jgi:hypothetical protein
VRLVAERGDVAGNPVGFWRNHRGGACGSDFPIEKLRVEILRLLGIAAADFEVNYGTSHEDCSYCATAALENLAAAGFCKRAFLPENVRRFQT